MLPITNKFTNCTISNRGGVKIQWIVMHYFGGLSSAVDCAGWFCNPSNKQGSADFCVDDTHIIQVNPDIKKYNTWHCGGGLQGYIRHSKFGICRNSNSIGIEMRPYNDRGAVKESQNAGWYFHDKTVQNAIDLVKYLMKKYSIDADHVIMHADVTGKYCPAPWLDRISEWEAFQKAIRSGSSSTPATTPATKPTTDKLYRVRKAWGDSKTQIGAYSSYDNAVAACDKHPGYTVFNNRGEALYPTMAEFKVRVKRTDLHMRKGPGTNYENAGYIKPGIYTIVKTVEAGGYLWGKLKSGAGYIALDYTEKV